MISILDRFARAREQSQLEHKKKEEAKRGTLRAGNTGALSSDGEFIGACPRRTMLRARGTELEKITVDKLIMFELGFANEDIVFQALERTLELGEVLLREEEIPIHWTTSTGVQVSGRPDIVLCSKLGEVTVPNLLLELKSVHSVWTTLKILFTRSPKLDNMLQAAHYMWQLGVPGKLIYKSYSILGQSISDWAYKLMPRPDAEHSEHVEFSQQKKDPSKYTIKGMKQFEHVYDLKFDSKGQLYFKTERESDKYWTRTIINQGDIKKYFDTVGQMESSNVLGPRPLTLKYSGEEDSYSICDYCPLNAVCNKLEKAEVTSTDKFLESVDEFVKTQIL